MCFKNITNMKLTTQISKIALSVLAAGAIVGAVIPQTTEASPITGGISFSGSVTPYTTFDGTGSVATDYTLAHSLVFGLSYVAAGANGSFAGVTQNTPVSMYSPLQINPAALPVPATLPLWTVNGFKFTLTALTEPNVSPTVLVLQGSGVISDSTPADSNTGTWVATFTTSGSTFSWNSSSAATVPDAGTSLLLLGLGLTALGIFAQIRKQVVA